MLEVHIRKHVRGTYGFFKKLDSTRLMNKERRNNIKLHFNNPLHIWCKEFERLNIESTKAHNTKNRLACTKVVTNVVYCLKQSMISKDFVCLTDKDDLISTFTCSAGDEAYACATKNDGSEQFLYFREITNCV